MSSKKPCANNKCQTSVARSLARLTKKAEPPPTRDVNRDSGTASANGGWLRRLVRRLHRDQSNAINNASETIETPINTRADFHFSRVRLISPHGKAMNGTKIAATM